MTKSYKKQKVPPSNFFKSMSQAQWHTQTLMLNQLDYPVLICPIRTKSGFKQEKTETQRLERQKKG